MNTRLTSIWTYDRIVKEGIVSNMQQFVYNYIKEHPNSCDRDIAEATDKRICSITPRRGEIERLGLIKEVGKEERYYTEGSKVVKSLVNVYKAVDQIEEEAVNDYIEWKKERQNKNKQSSKKKTDIIDLLTQTYLSRRADIIEKLKGKEEFKGKTAIRYIITRDLVEKQAKCFQYFYAYPKEIYNTTYSLDFREGGVYKVKLVRDVI